MCGRTHVCLESSILPCVHACAVAVLRLWLRANGQSDAGEPASSGTRYVLGGVDIYLHSFGSRPCTLGLTCFLVGVHMTCRRLATVTRLLILCCFERACLRALPRAQTNAHTLLHTSLSPPCVPPRTSHAKAARGNAQKPPCFLSSVPTGGQVEAAHMPP